MKKASLIFVLLINLSFILYAQQTVVIGSQVWMTKNLDVVTFRNGDTIPQAKTDAEWEAAGENMQPAWCYYNNDLKNGTKYGKLYNGYAVYDPRGIAPLGYHIPTNAEWTILIDYLGGKNVAGKKMKNTSGWYSYGSKSCPNCVDWNAEYRKKVPCHTCKDTRRVDASIGTNSSGFSGLPGGSRFPNGLFFGIGAVGDWWSTTENHYKDFYYRSLYFNSFDGYVVITSGFPVSKSSGYSVRCLKD
jgi:uncharacterized protein (TIGR02145 family)